MSTKKLKAEEYAHLPEHPLEPFLRSIGVALARTRCREINKTIKKGMEGDYYEKL